MDNMNETPTPKKRSQNKYLKIALIAVLAVAALGVAFAGYIYAASPAVIRNPKLEHYHFRMQILVDGKAEDFSGKAYQTGYAKDTCTANLPEQPIHFHDNKDQFVHIHWEGITGGMVLKYYGWNYIGGIGKALGYKLDDLKDIQNVSTHGNLLPAVPHHSNFYVYTGDENGYKERGFEDFKMQDLEQFFGKTSNFPAHELNKQQTSLLDTVFPKAYAHGDEDHGTTAVTPETQEEKLKRINNLVGNVVIFVQKDKPTDQQIKDRFNKLEPLSDSTCAG
ncbi:MAG: hypothetical protein ACREGJ_01240 [Candidatus Saccharimonadales bacterium]